jgi:hypothetical protein
MDGILVATWGAAVVVVLLYVLFVVWRVRVHRQRRTPKAADAATATHDDRLARALDAAARISGQTPQPTSAPTSTPVVHEAPLAPVAPPQAPSLTSVAEVLAGIRLPNDLAPLTTMAPRVGAGDRVAFWTDEAGAEVVGPAFIDELRRIGCEVTQIDMMSFAATRDGTRAIVLFHPDGRLARIDDALAFPSVPAAVVVEIWLLV